MSSPLTGFRLTGLDRLDPVCEMALVGEEGLARRGGDDLPAPAGDRLQLEMLAKIGLQHDVGRSCR